MPSFLSHLADKAQSALSGTPLAQHLPAGRPSSDAGSQGESQSQGGGYTKSHAFENITHQFRTIQQQYSSVSPVQKIITSQKGVSIDHDSLARDLHAHSKELYMWGQNEGDDIRDVTDRLGWLTYNHGALASTLSNKIDEARVPFKTLRAAENGLAPRRTIRANLENQIAKLEYDNQRGNQQKIAELKIQLHKAEQDDLANEKEVELLKRKALRETEEKTWEAIREYAEKLVLLSQAASAVIPALPAIPPSKEHPYEGTQTTASVRASMQQALDQYQPNSLNLVLAQPSPADLRRSDTRSFGETHAQELSRIGSQESRPPVAATPTPPRVATPDVHTAHTHQPVVVTKTKPAPVPIPVGSQSPPLDPSKLNQAPAPIPIPLEDKGKAPVLPPIVPEVASSIPPEPTIAETGVPKSAGPGGPGPATGSLLTIHSEDKIPKSTPSAPAAGTTSPPAIHDQPSTAGPPGYGGARPYESAEDEKQRLQREEREKLSASDTPGAGAPPPHHDEAPPPAETKKFESAEEEKKRLEREEREKLLKQGGGGPGPQGDGDNPPPPDSELPPYEEY
ncbi:hypothetical protein NLI96_g8055 [Meripilus lineatus]|uniref:Sphingolipid long chain base-responsive protein LSP1 n=1 Tax=Meripilus lineatus TaxID=2056292 RepID=A0AAD5UZM7_9APHY|nr:hypothetical protein NLI96_g8055 [Physisporinus lineatus]